VIEQPFYDLDALRALFRVTRELTSFNHASISPLPDPVRQMTLAAGDGRPQRAATRSSRRARWAVTGRS
jgi:hypothetical protein